MERPSFSIDSVGAKRVAVCTCGWRSEPAINAGLAGSTWDHHVQEEHAEP